MYKRQDVLSAILDLLCSSIGSLTNPTKVAATISTCLLYTSILGTDVNIVATKTM